jgi:hypothetical protein
LGNEDKLATFLLPKTGVSMTMMDTNLTQAVQADRQQFTAQIHRLETVRTMLGHDTGPISSRYSRTLGCPSGVMILLTHVPRSWTSRAPSLQCWRGS